MPRIVQKTLLVVNVKKENLTFALQLLLYVPCTSLELLPVLIIIVSNKEIWPLSLHFFPSRTKPWGTLDLAELFSKFIFHEIQRVPIWSLHFWKKCGVNQSLLLKSSILRNWLFHFALLVIAISSYYFFSQWICCALLLIILSCRHADLLTLMLYNV